MRKLFILVVLLYSDVILVLLFVVLLVLVCSVGPDILIERMGTRVLLRAIFIIGRTTVGHKQTTDLKSSGHKTTGRGRGRGECGEIKSCGQRTHPGRI